MSVTGARWTRARRVAAGLAPLLAVTSLTAAVVVTGAVPSAAASTPFISEIHYDNAGTDIDERIEITAAIGTDLTGWQLVRYNGAVPGAATVYTTPLQTTPLTGVIGGSDPSGDGVIVISFAVDGLQNGASDGVALVSNTGAVVEFLSYEGVITASGGPANGLTSTDIGVLETNTTPVGQSLQKIGGVWTGPAANTFGAVNGAALAITTQPASTTIASGATATLTVVATGTALTYQWYQGTSGNTAVPVVGATSASFTTPALTATTSYWVRVTSGATSVDSVTATVTVGAVCTGPVTRIGAVQGPGATAAITGSVTVRGTVVGDYEGPSPALRGFYLQDAGDGLATTSDGIFVFNNIGGNSPNLVDPGDVVEVTGTAGEFEGQTQVSAVSLTDCGTTGTVTPTDLTLPRAAADDLEPYEGMLVRFTQTLTVTEFFQLGRFGQVVVSSQGKLRQPTDVYDALDPQRAALQAANDLDRLIIDDGDNGENVDPIVFGRGGAPLAANNTLRGGDTITNAVGVLSYTWAGNVASPNAYRLRPVNALTGAAPFVAVNQRPTSPPVVGGDLQVVGANVENFFNTFGNGACSFGVGGAAADCRGASNTAEFGKQIEKVVDALTSSQAEVIGLVEIENDGYGPTSAIARLRDEMNLVDGPGTWAYIDVDANTSTVNAAGTDAIKVGLMYRPGAVTPVPGTTRTAIAAAATFERIPVSQAFRTSSGEVFSVVVNHFKSKSTTGCPASGTDSDQNGQGCFNDRRVSQANALTSFLTTGVIPAAGGDQDVLVIGDLNSYASEDPTQVLLAAGYTDLARQFGGPTAYSYVFNGQWGYLDYALASPSLLPKITGTAAHHINADEPTALGYADDFKTLNQQNTLYQSTPRRYRASDHDQVVVGISATPVAAGPVYALVDDATLGPLMAAIAAAVPDLELAVETPTTFAVGTTCPAPSPLPATRQDSLAMLGGDPYVAVGGGTVAALPEGCRPAAVTTFQSP